MTQGQKGGLGLRRVRLQLWLSPQCYRDAGADPDVGEMPPSLQPGPQWGRN